MDQRTILVIGATGTVGAPVARQLRDDGYQVRLLVRDQKRAAAQLGSGFEYIQGSVEDHQVVQQALSGCIGAHLSLQAGSNPKDIEQVEHLGMIRVVELAAKQHLTRLTYVSGMFVGAEVGSAALDDQAKRSVEQALQQSGMSFTIFRPTYFMDNLPKHLQGKRAMVLGKQPHPLHLVAASDFGRMVSRAFQVPGGLEQNLLCPGAGIAHPGGGAASLLFPTRALGKGDDHTTLVDVCDGYAVFRETDASHLTHDAGAPVHRRAW